MPSFFFLPILSLLSRYLNLAAIPTCTVLGGTSDDTAAIRTAFNDCSNGGLVVLDKSYILGSPLNTTNLTNVNIQFSGNIALNPDISFWKNNAFNLTFQDASTAWLIGGTNVHIYGGGTFNGSGDIWYAAGVNGPVPWTVANSSNVLVENINMEQSPYWHNFIANSTDVIFNNIYLRSVAGNSARQLNTDGFNTFNSSRVTLTNTVVVNGGECVSLKANSTDVRLENLVCQGSKAITMGPIGDKDGVKDIIKSVFVKNVTMLNTESGARIQVFGAGGGSGYVTNVTFQDVKCSACDIPIVIDQCFQSTNCFNSPSRVLINDIHFNSVTGSGARDKLVVSMTCGDVCDTITAAGTNLRGRSGDAQYFCKNVNSLNLLDFPCSDGTVSSNNPPPPPAPYTYSTTVTTTRSATTSITTTSSSSSSSFYSPSTTRTSSSSSTTTSAELSAKTTSSSSSSSKTTSTTSFALSKTTPTSKTTSPKSSTTKPPKSIPTSEKPDSDPKPTSKSTTTLDKVDPPKTTLKSSPSDAADESPTKTPTPASKPPKTTDPPKSTPDNNVQDAAKSKITPMSKPPKSTPPDKDAQDAPKAKGTPTSKPPKDPNPPKTTLEGNPPPKDLGDAKAKSTPSKRWSDELDLY